MTDWIDFFVYAVFILIMFFVQPLILGMLSVPMIADRNTQWLEENHETLQRMERVGACMLWLQFAFGVASLAALTMLQLQVITVSDLLEKWMFLEQLSAITGSDLPEKWMLLWLFTMVSFLISMLFFVVNGIIWYLVWMPKIPVAERRQADLQRRSINDFVPLTLRLVTYLLVFIMLAAWVVVAVFGWYAEPAFWIELITYFALCGFSWLGTSYAIGRRPNIMDRLFGPGYRHGDVLFNFSSQLLLVIMGTVRLYEELADVIVLNISRAIFLGLVLYLIGWILWFGYQVVRNLPPRGGAVISESADNKLINVK